MSSRNLDYFSILGLENFFFINSSDSQKKDFFEYFKKKKIIVKKLEKFFFNKKTDLSLFLKKKNLKKENLINLELQKFKKQKDRYYLFKNILFYF